MTAAPLKLPLDRPDPNAPPPEHARLRAASPVARVRTPDGRDAWLVTSYEAVTAVLADQRFGMTPPGTAAAGNDTLFQDGEPHARLRRLVAKAFTARGVTALRPRIEELTAGFADRLAAAGPPADLVAEFAAPVSITTIGELLGVTIHDRETFRKLADTVSSTDFSFDEAGAAEAMRAWEELGGFIAGLVAVKRAELGEDLLSAMIDANDAEDGRLGDGELIAMASTLITAGYTTTRNAICAGVVRLDTEDRFAGLAGEPERVPAVVEELLRHQSGQIAEPFPRFAHTEVELAGAVIAAGDLVLVRTEAANHDPAVFASPELFEPGRTVRLHVAFGRGPHHCLGAALARVELGAALCALSRRLPGLRLVGEPGDIAWNRAVDVGLDRLDVTW